MKQVFRAALVSIALASGATLPAAAQQFDPAVLEATVARLSLTEGQKAVARPVIEAGIRERMQILRDAGFERSERPSLRQLLRVRDPIWASRARTEAQLSGILSPAQMQVYREIVEERRQKIRAGLQ
jgi:hypothetical protein